ncbi:F510_1955 family glycosylhydrolase [Arthrobacter glacialis]|uniref:Exo-alpha-sialidase n=1 Tax=Arthrobacter glacialis TaxID=1664 RepID=A0A2S3ZTG6_ARTGL|nr:hypothetical protein [Arthrobacter glacialis]POH72561.1 hypothetical protein CVS27_15245 [Arthrobacter glacialis]
MLPLVLAGCSTPPDPQAVAAVGSDHVHGIYVDPSSTKVLLATHDGLFDATGTARKKISENTIDLMGFTSSAEPGTYYASGHPGPDSSLPNPLGLVKSTDEGKTWQQVSRGGQSDFHALTVSGGSLVAFDGQLRTSTDGIAWSTSPATFSPAGLAGNPASTVVLATTEAGIQRSIDAGQTWELVPKGPIIQFAAFADSEMKAPTEAVGVAPDGSVYVSNDSGLTWTERGKITGQVEAITALAGTTGKPWIWAATTDGVQVSTDGGATFQPAAS